MNDLKRTVILFNPMNIRGIGDFTLPMGLIMSAIKIHEKYNVVIVDQRIDKDWRQHLANLLEENPLCIGITAMTGRQIHEALRVSEIAKNKNCPVVWGGIHASLLPEQTISHPLVDYVIEGEGEETFAEFIDALASERSVNKIAGVWTKEFGQPSCGGKRPFVDLDKLPPIPFHLVDFKKYVNPRHYKGSIVMYTSRGCPQRCTFCYNNTYNRSHWRAFSSSRVLDDMQRIQSEYSGINHFELWDDNFFVDLKRAGEIADGIRRLRPRVTWSVLGAHIHDIIRMDTNYLALLKDSGLKEMVVGVESGSQRIIDLIQKNFTVEQLFHINRLLGDFGICPTYSFISGVPGENDNDIKKTIEVMFRLMNDNPNIRLGTIKPFICYPGTTIYEKALELGFVPPKHLDDWSSFVWTDYLNLRIPWVPKKRRELLSWLYYYSLLMNPEYMFINSKLFKIIVSCLRPIAKWRMKHFMFNFPIEAWLIHIFQRKIL